MFYSFLNLILMQCCQIERFITICRIAKLQIWLFQILLLFRTNPVQFNILIHAYVGSVKNVCYAGKLYVLTFYVGSRIGEWCIYVLPAQYFFSIIRLLYRKNVGWEERKLFGYLIH